MSAQHLFTMVVTASGLALMLLVFFYAWGQLLRGKASGSYPAMIAFSLVTIVAIVWIYQSSSASVVIPPMGMFGFSVVYYLLLYVIQLAVRQYRRYRSKGAELDRIRHKNGFSPLPQTRR